MRFTQWMHDFGTTKEEINYKTILIYMQELKSKQIKIRTIQNYICNLKVYFTFLQHENYRSDNPIQSVSVKGVSKTIITNILEKEVLEDLYFSYPIKQGNISSLRDKIIVGLLVYQGLRPKELENITRENIAYYKATIHISETKNTNSRTLQLESWQILDMMKYTGQLPENQEYLLLTNYGNRNLSNVLKRIDIGLKCINFSYQNRTQLRSSVIVNWLKINGLRKTQYLAGHRYISATERYKQEDLQKLEEMIHCFHPLR